MIRISILNDNRCDNNEYECEHGISFFIEYYDKKILFDCGQTDIFIKNAKKLNIDINKLDAIVLSHGDYDHGNGLKYLNNKTDLICHPDFDVTRISKRTGNNNGLNQTREELQKRFNLIVSKEPYYISDKVIFLGEIERKNNFESGKNLPAYDKNGNTYTHLDDSGLVIETEEGLIVFSGCAHSGICNTIEYAKKITGNNRISMVIGGFHLKKIDEQTISTVNYMKNNNVKKVMLAHCTSDVVCDYFLSKLPNETVIIKTGKIYEL